MVSGYVLASMFFPYHCIAPYFLFFLGLLCLYATQSEMRDLNLFIYNKINLARLNATYLLYTLALSPRTTFGDFSLLILAYAA